MKAIIQAIAIAATITPSSAQAPRQVQSGEVTIVTGDMVDPSKLSTEQRLDHVCQASGYLKKQPLIQRNKDAAETIDWIISLSCKVPRPH